MFEKNVLGLDISDHSIEALVLSRQAFGQPKVAAYARTLLRSKIVENGIIKNSEKLAEVIGNLLQSGAPRPITAKYCVLSLPESQYFTTVFRLPAGLRRDEIKNTIPLTAEEVIPFKSADIYFDFKILGVVNDTQEIFYAAVPKAVVDSYVELLKKVNLVPVAFDLESISSARALFAAGRKIENAKLIMDIGARTTNLNIFDQAGIRQGLTLNIAGDRFNKAIMTNLKLTAKQAEAVKTHQGFRPGIQDGKILFILQKELDKIIAESRKFIDFYQSRYQRKIDEVVIIGGSALLPNIEQYVADDLALVTNLGNPLQRIFDTENFLKMKDKAVLFTNVVGLALRGLEKDPAGCDINLLPSEPRHFSFLPGRGDKKSWRRLYILLTLLVVSALALGGFLLVRRQIRDLFFGYYFSPEPRPVSELNVDDSVLDLPIGNLDAVTDAEAPASTTAATSTLLTAPAATTTPTTTAIQTATTAKPTLPAAPPVASLFSVKIKQTSLGYVNVRSGPGLDNSKIGQVNPGKVYTVIKEANGWYQLKLDNNKTGWVLAVYAEKL